MPVVFSSPWWKAGIGHRSAGSGGMLSLWFTQLCLLPCCSGTRKVISTWCEPKHQTSSNILSFPTSQPATRDTDCLCGLIGIVMLLYSATLSFRSREVVIMTLKHGLTTQWRQKSQWTERTIPLGLLVKGNKAQHRPNILLRGQRRDMREEIGKPVFHKKNVVSRRLLRCLCGCLDKVNINVGLYRLLYTVHILVHKQVSYAH